MLTSPLHTGAAISAACVLLGCGSMPSQVVYPGFSPTETQNPRDDYIVADKKLSDPKVQDILPVARTFERVKAQIDAHYATWNLESSNLNGGRDSLNNTKFGGAVLGAIGAIASKVDVTKVGAAAAGGAGVWGDTYNLKVQAENYRFAADAMRCIHKQVTKLPPAFWEATYETVSGREGSMKLSIEDYEQFGSQGDSLRAAFNTLQTLFDTINTSINTVRDRLQAKQDVVVLAAPSVDAIKAALTAAEKEKPESDVKAGSIKGTTEKRTELGLTYRAAEFVRRRGQAETQDAATKKEVDAAIARLSRDNGLTLRLVGLTADGRVEYLLKLVAAASITKADYETAIQLPAELSTCTEQISK